MMKSLLATLLLPISAFRVHAGEEPFIRAGLSVSAAAKFRIFRNGAPYTPWGSAGAGIVMLVGGTEAGSPGLFQKFDCLIDNSRYKIAPGTVFGIERYALSWNPEVYFSTGSEHLHMTAGFALQWAIGKSLYISSTGNGFSGNLQDLSTAADVADRSERRLMPLLTAGVAYSAGRRLWMQLSLKQAMQNAYTGGIKILPGNEINLYYRPFYMAVAFGYYL